MSDKLIIEFYSRHDSDVPVACILAFYGGDNPSSAATTLVDFFEAMSVLPEPRFDDAGLLAARFVVWQSAKGAERSSLDFSCVCLVPFQSENNYQTVKIYADADRPHVRFVIDQYTTNQELNEAEIILGPEYVLQA